MIVQLGTNFPIDVQSLIETRMLAQANSGGGKSYLIRKLLEITNGKVQQIVLDVEGDFPSLRGRYDFILAGKGGDIPADTRSAEMLARKVLELRADLIVDLYELKHHDRIKFVRLFLESMINAPKDLWHPVLIVIDEAHIFAPESGKAESMGAVIDLCTRGRKRGFCAVLATQRLSKLNKDAAAECNNKLIGRTGLDIDLKRAGDELGFPSSRLNELRSLNPGEFYAFGPAISRSVVKGMIGKVETSHPKVGLRTLGHTPPASATVRATLAKLADLPKVAEEEKKDKESLQLRVKDLERQLREKPKAEIDEARTEKLVKQATADLESQMLRNLKELREEIAKLFMKYTDKRLEAPAKPVLRMPTVMTAQVSRPHLTGEEYVLGACEKKILGFLNIDPNRSFTKVQVGALTGYAHSSGGFNNAISRLSQMGLIERQSGNIRICPGAEINIGPGVPHRLQDWVNKLGACERKIYELLLEHPEEIPKHDLAELTGYSAGSGGFNNALSRLNTLGLIERLPGGQVCLNKEITDFLEVE